MLHADSPAVDTESCSTLLICFAEAAIVWGGKRSAEEALHKTRRVWQGRGKEPVFVWLILDSYNVIRCMLGSWAGAGHNHGRGATTSKEIQRMPNYLESEMIQSCESRLKFEHDSKGATLPEKNLNFRLA